MRILTWQLPICRKELNTQNKYKKNNYRKKIHEVITVHVSDENGTHCIVS